MKWFCLKRLLWFLLFVASPALSSSPYELAGYGHEKLSTVVVTGSVECQGPSNGGSPPSSFPISGTLVAVKCRRTGRGKAVWSRAKTDEYGDFVIDLPSHLHAIPNLQRRCVGKVIHIPKTSKCRQPRSKVHNSLTLLSFGNGIRAYTAGIFTLQHLTPASSLADVNADKV